MDRVTMYETADGKIFRTLVEAEQHERSTALVQRLRDEVWYRGIDPEEVVEWLKNNFTLTPKE